MLEWSDETWAQSRKHKARSTKHSGTATSAFTGAEMAKVSVDCDSMTIIDTMP